MNNEESTTTTSSEENKRAKVELDKAEVEEKLRMKEARIVDSYIKYLHDEYLGACFKLGLPFILLSAFFDNNKEKGEVKSYKFNLYEVTFKKKPEFVWDWWELSILLTKEQLQKTPFADFLPDYEKKVTPPKEKSTPTFGTRVTRQLKKVNHERLANNGIIFLLYMYNEQVDRAVLDIKITSHEYVNDNQLRYNITIEALNRWKLQGNFSEDELRTYPTLIGVILNYNNKNHVFEI